jgi:PBP1b-binding outer membrane lipoprotein LpoB
MLTNRILLIIIAPFLFAGCSSTKTVRVAVPPRVDLRPYPIVGLVSFSSNANGDLERMSTQKFLQAVQCAQPGTRVVELGSEKQVLASVGASSFDAATIKKIKEKHGVDALALGRLDMSKAKPSVNLSSSIWKTVNARADVNVALSARLLETSSGATMWTDSSQLTTTIAHANFNDHGEGSFGARDPEATYGAMIDNMVFTITDGFRTHYVNRRVPKDQVIETASGRD